MRIILNSNNLKPHAATLNKPDVAGAAYGNISQQPLACARAISWMPQSSYPNSSKEERMEVRRIDPSELNSLLDLYQHLHKDDDPLPGASRVEAIWRELQSNPRYRYFGVYVADKLICSCTITVVPNLTRGCKPYGLIENVVTHAAHRNRGYGKAVLAEALSFAWSQGCYKVMLMTGRKDETTFQFYESAGFNRHDKQAFTAKESKCRSI